MYTHHHTGALYHYHWCTTPTTGELTNTGVVDQATANTGVSHKQTLDCVCYAPLDLQDTAN